MFDARPLLKSCWANDLASAQGQCVVPLHEDVATVAKRWSSTARGSTRRPACALSESKLRREQSTIERILINREISEIPAIECDALVPAGTARRFHVCEP